MPCYDPREDVWYQLNEIQDRLDRYVRQFCNLTHIVSDAAIIKLCAEDKEFRDLFIQLQDRKRVLGFDWIECKFNDRIILTPWLEVTLVKHKGLNYSV